MRREIDAQVARLLTDVPDGADLTDEQVILINYALRTCATAMDRDGARRWQAKALAAGVTPAQLHEVVTLMSSVGFHAFFEASRDLARVGAAPSDTEPLDPDRQRLWDTYIGSRRYWDVMESEIEGFLPSLLRMSPTVFEAFINYAALPYRSGLLPPLTIELIGMAADACPSHVYLPGMRMHLRNAVRLGAGRVMIEHAMRIAAVSPRHVGVS